MIRKRRDYPDGSAFGLERPVWELGRVFTSIYGERFTAVNDNGRHIWMGQAMA